MAITYGVKVPDEQAEEIIKAWRQANANIVRLWRGIETAALNAVKAGTGHTYSYGCIKFGVRGRFLHCRLPSGRLLAYADPVPCLTTTKYGQEKEVVSFMGMNTMTNRWERQKTYGGSLVENVVQAVARDLLAEAMIRLEAKGYPVIAHVHDEVISEVDAGFGDLKEYEAITSMVPAWATDLPVEAKGWTHTRYMKE
jgi:DNA polymerase